MAESTRTLRINVVVNSQGGNRNLRQVNQSLGGTKAAALGAGAAIGGMVARLGGIALLAEGFRRAASTAISMNQQLETSTLQFQGMFGSAARAEQHVRSLFEFAQRTPFETGPIIEASRLMQVFGGDALNTTENLRMVGDAAAQTNAPINELGMWVGRLHAALEGGQPIGEATLRLMEMGAITPQVVQQLRDMQKAGVDTTETWGVFTSAMDEHAGAMERQAESFSGLISSLTDNTGILIARVGEPIFDMAKGGLTLANEKVSELSTRLEGGIAVWNSASQAILGNRDALMDLVSSLGMTTEEYVKNQQDAGLLAEQTRVLTEAMSGPAGLDLGITSAADAMAEYEPHAVALNEETARMRVVADEAAQAFLRLRAAEDELLVTAPQVRLSWEEMITPGRKLGVETLPVLESRTLDVSGAMLGGVPAAQQWGGALIGEFGSGGRVTDAIGAFQALTTGGGGFFPSLNSGLANNALSWIGWGQSVVSQVQSVWGWIQKIGGGSSSAAGIAGAGGAISGAAGVATAFLGPIGAGVALAQLWQALGSKGAPTGLGHPTAGISSPETSTGSPSDEDFTPLASGGIVTRPTMALIGEAGPEAVIPLGRGGAGGVTVHMTFNGFGGSMRDAERVAEIVDRRIMRRLGNQRVLAGVV